MPVPLDEFPIHQVPLSMAYVGSSDRNFYDRCYYNAHDRTGDIFFISGAGVYANLGVQDAYATVRRGDRQWAVRFSDEISDDRLNLNVGPYRVEVIEPLHTTRIVCDGDDYGLGFDLTWRGSFPALDEQHHVLQAGPRVIIDGRRFAQVGTWEGELRVEGDVIEVSPDHWVGTRDRSWGIRPVGEGEPAGRPGATDGGGFWWLYVPIRFEEFAVIVIIQEATDGTRTLNDATRVWPDGRVEQLGWPRVDITYRSGTRHPTGATLHLTARDGTPLVLEVEPLTAIALHVGAGYGGDPEWGHGHWKGPKFAEGRVYDLNDPEIVARFPFGVIDHAARATLNGAEGWGLFEHASFGRHDPSGFTDWGSVAP